MSLPLPSTLTPSKLGKFVNCPLAFRYSYIERVEEPATIYQLRGTLIHRALQVLFSRSDAEDRTSDQAKVALQQAWSEMSGTEEFEALGLDEKGLNSFIAEAHSLIEHYLSLEDPTAVRPVGVELDLRAKLGDIELRGIIDRLDRLPNGEFVLVDYKTGRSPRVEHTRGGLVGVQFYAYLCEQVLGIRPREVRLMYLKDQVVVVNSPTDQSMRGLAQRAVAVWAAIERACANEDFRPNPTPLCKSCSFQARCPAFSDARQEILID